MDIILYKTNDDENVVNKTLSDEYTIQIDLKQPTNITQPLLRLYEVEGLDIKAMNYAHIPEFNRYYFIRSVNTLVNKTYDLMLDCDVLYTYRDHILNNGAEISRAIKTGDYREIAPSSEVRKETDVYKYTKGFTGESSMILSTVGQGGF